MTHFSELKIGDYFNIKNVESNYLEINKVVGQGLGNYDTSGICKSKFTFKSVTTKAETEILISDNEYLEDNGICPIELTEDLILKCGFVRVEYHEQKTIVCYERKIRNVSTNEIYPQIVVYNNQLDCYSDYYGNNFKYLHQFQEFLSRTNQETSKRIEIYF